MESYVELRVRHDPEFSKNHLLAAIFRKLHRRLIELRSVGIGVSFPEFCDRHLGSIIRVHGTSSNLSDLMKTDWLIGLHDHVIVSAVMPVPADVRHRTVQRVQPKSNVERLRRRAVKRHRLSPEQAREKIPAEAEEMVSLPYIKMVSETSKQSFNLFVRHGQIVDSPNPGKFSSYGMSSVSTVPWF